MMNVGFEKLNVKTNENGLKMFSSERFNVSEVESLWFSSIGQPFTGKMLLVEDKKGEYNGLIEYENLESFESEYDFSSYLDNFFPEEDYYIDSIGFYCYGNIYDHEEYKKAVC